MKLKGVVVKGSQDGRKLGFPTANLELTSVLEIDYGVYASKVIVKGIEYQSITHFGPRLVFNEVKPLFEVHIFDFDQEIYGEMIEVELIQFIRPTKQFDNLDAMVDQIRQDIDQSKKYFELNGN